MTRAIKKFIAITLFFISSVPLSAQVQQEIAPPYNIKTAAFIKDGQNVYPFFKLGDNFSFVFDDLFGNEAN
jgi:hypothetical protein